MAAFFNNKKNAFVLVLLWAVVCAFLFTRLFTFVRCYHYAANIPPEPVQLMRIRLYGSSDLPEGSTVSASISLLNRAGQEIAVIERSWPEPYLGLDFSFAQFSDRTYFFPKEVFGTSSVRVKNALNFRKPGTRIDRYYTEHGHCLLGTDLYEQKGLFCISLFAFKKNTVNLSSLENGRYYGIFVNQGTIAVVPE